ncbi:MAG: phosphate ABC transporter substrate-binding protein [Alphaproteobacteria bacterium]|jgi:phosphate transport system substrate-binding protein|nr:phosphate ABC transporter substrate-binding protein [Alphaproteobacteria bacterium]
MKKTFLLATVATIAMVGTAQARDEIRIVGSSTVFPFTSTVIERFAQSTSYPAPIIESTGTGGGMRFFCAGVGEEHPDITGASRPMKSSEFEMCVENGVTSITEIQIGYDGITLANSRDAEQMDITKAQLFSALAAEVAVDGEIVENPYTNWSEIDPSLPDAEIEVLGPPPTSGTRDAFVELVMEAGCEEFEAIAALEESDEDRFEAVCATMREDGAFIEAGENDNLIVQRLQANPDAFGIFGFSFLEENSDVIQGSLIEGTPPTFDSIASGDYPVSRSLFVYVKNAHVDVIPGLREFIAEYTSDQAWGPEGYLAGVGLIPLDEEMRSAERNEAMNLEEMTRY